MTIQGDLNQFLPFNQLGFLKNYAPALKTESSAATAKQTVVFDSKCVSFNIFIVVSVCVSIVIIDFEIESLSVKIRVTSNFMIECGSVCLCLYVLNYTVSVQN